LIWDRSGRRFKEGRRHIGTKAEVEYDMEIERMKNSEHSENLVLICHPALRDKLCVYRVMAWPSAYCLCA